MGILRLLAIGAALASCYAPDLTDCTVSCMSDNDCGTGQRCVDHLCSREGVTCVGEPPPSPTGDAGATVGDAPPDAAPDGPGQDQGILYVRIEDQGMVHFPGRQTCDSAIERECTYIVDLGIPLTLDAEPHHNRFFEHWEDACSGEQMTCIVIPVAFETRVTAKFHKD